jgi:hypothetical protein
LVAAQMTESAFFRGEDFSINDVELFRALAPRIIPGGMILLESTPFTQTGLLYDFFTSDFGHPKSVMVAHTPTLLLRPDPRMVGIVQRERERDPDNAAREFDGEFMTSGSGLFFDSVSIDRCVVPEREMRVEAPKGATLAAGADFGFRSDASALAIAARVGDLAILLATDELRPTRHEPLVPSKVVAHFAATLGLYGVGSVHADQCYSESIRELLRVHNLRLVDAPENQESKSERYVAVRSLIREGKVRIPRDPTLITQLKSVVYQPASNSKSMKISSPRKGNSHGDVASAFVGAIYALGMQQAPRRGCPGFVGGGDDFDTMPRGFDDERYRKPFGF